MARSVKRLNKKGAPIEDLLNIIDRFKLEEVKQAISEYDSVQDVLRKYKNFVRVLYAEDNIEAYFEACVKNGIVAIDTETNDSVDVLVAKIVGLCLYTPYNRPVYIPINHRDKFTNELLPNQVSLERLLPLLEKFKKTKNIFHNAKFDVNVIYTNFGIRLPIYWDTMVVAKLLNENIYSAALKIRYRDDVEPAQPIYNISKLFESNETADVINFGLYSAIDPYDAYKLFNYQEAQLEYPSMSRLKKLVHEVEIKVTEISGEIEYDGVRFDKNLCEAYKSIYTKRTDEKLKEILDFFEPYRRDIKKWPIEPASGDQILEAFCAIGLCVMVELDDPKKPGRKLQVPYFADKYGSPLEKANTQAETLKNLGSKWPICLTILDWRSDNHMITSFFSPLLDKINSETGRIHANYNQLGDEDRTIKTGRFSMRDPNLQQMPNFNDSVRLCFNAGEGNCLIGKDYSQQEPRFLASITGEEALIDGYNLRTAEFPKGKDYYAQLASAAFNRDYWDCVEFRKDGSYSEEGKKYRSMAKGIQLGLTYGMGPKSMAAQIGVEYDEAVNILTDFFSTYRKVAQWREFNMDKMKTYGFMETMLGRRRRLPDAKLKPIEIRVYDQIKTETLIPFSVTNQLKVINLERSLEETKRFDKIKDWKTKEREKKTCQAMGFEVIDNGAFIARTTTQCTNSVIQGGAADMTKLAMIEIYNSPILRKYFARLRLLIHDEIIIEGPIEYLKEIETEFHDCMLRAPRKICKVEMACDTEMETRWKLNHLVGSILKEKDKGKSNEKLLEKYSEFNKEDLLRILNKSFNPSTEVLRIS